MAAAVLALFAHPDDETFGPGGTLARLAHEGSRVDLVCATRGEAGTIGDSPLLGRRRLAQLREEELRAACTVLGIRPPTLLSLPDGGLRRLEETTLLRPFVRAIRGHRPDILVTFHPNGISGHPDHRTVTARAATAFELAADAAVWPDLGAPHATRRLWAYAVPESRAARITYRKIHAVPDAELDAVVDARDWLDHKHRAVEAHASQKPFVDNLDAFLGGIEEYWREEAFVLLAARDPLPGDAARPVGDLLLGLPGPRDGDAG